MLILIFTVHHQSIMPGILLKLVPSLLLVLAKPHNRISSLAFSRSKPGRYAQQISRNVIIWPQAQHLDCDDKGEDAVFDANRRQAIRRTMGSFASGTLALLPSASPGSAANLPPSTGADMSRTGSLDKLIPLAAMEYALMSAKQELLKARDGGEISADTIRAMSRVLSVAIPSEQMLFKRKFDEYSEPVSYKQKWMDQNAFLVYYTKGFDGPSRPPMESSADPIPKQAIQYGLRNDAWSNYDELLGELSFFSPSSSSSIDDILRPLDNCIAAFEAYLSYAPASDVAEVRRRIKKM